MDSSGQMLVIVVMLILAAVGLVWHSRRSRTLLERWAARHGYRIIEADYRNFFRCPFFWTTSKSQTVYRVTVEIKAGVVRGGWVRCGSWSLGLISDRAEVRWDAAPPKSTGLMHDRWLDG